MKKILIGTHNAGKFREIGTCLQKDTKKFHLHLLKLKFQKKLEKPLFRILNLKLTFFQST